MYSPAGLNPYYEIENIEPEPKLGGIEDIDMIESNNTYLSAKKKGKSK